MYVPRSLQELSTTQKCFFRFVKDSVSVCMADCGREMQDKIDQTIQAKSLGGGAFPFEGTPWNMQQVKWILREWIIHPVKNATWRTNACVSTHDNTHVN